MPYLAVTQDSRKLREKTGAKRDQSENTGTIERQINEGKRERERENGESKE